MEDQGKPHGKCNRRACNNRPAVCYSDVENAYYCVRCAAEINLWLPANVKPIDIPKGEHRD
jgi:hypothetical protein